MRIRKSVLLVASICLVLVLASLSALVGCTTQAPATKPAQTTTTPAAATSTQSYTIRIGGGNVPGHTAHGTVFRWIDAVKKATNGRVQVNFYEGGTIGKQTELYDLTLNGVVEAAYMAEFWAGGRFPITEGINSLPFSYKTLNDLAAVDDALFQQGLMKEMEPFKVLYHAPIAQMTLFTKKKITTMDDLKGLKIRATGNNAIAMGMLGATAVVIPGDEEYMALERGILDGNLTGVDNIISRKEYEVISYGCTTPLAMGGFVFIMNKNYWNKLPADIQAAIENANKSEGGPNGAHVAGMNKIAEAAWKQLEGKITIYSLSADEIAKWRTKVASIEGDWIKNMEAKGLPGQKAVDAMKAVMAKR